MTLNAILLFLLSFLLFGCGRPSGEDGQPASDITLELRELRALASPYEVGEQIAFSLLVQNNKNTPILMVRPFTCSIDLIVESTFLHRHGTVVQEVIPSIMPVQESDFIELGPGELEVLGLDGRIVKGTIRSAWSERHRGVFLVFEGCWAIHLPMGKRYRVRAVLPHNLWRAEYGRVHFGLTNIYSGSLTSNWVEITIRDPLF
jgi:hypothetical protein